MSQKNNLFRFCPDCQEWNQPFLLNLPFCDECWGKLVGWEEEEEP